MDQSVPSDHQGEFVASMVTESLVRMSHLGPYPVKLHTRATDRLVHRGYAKICGGGGDYRMPLSLGYELSSRVAKSIYVGMSEYMSAGFNVLYYGSHGSGGCYSTKHEEDRIRGARQMWSDYAPELRSALIPLTPFDIVESIMLPMILGTDLWGSYASDVRTALITWIPPEIAELIILPMVL